MFAYTYISKILWIIAEIWISNDLIQGYKNLYMYMPNLAEIEIYSAHEVQQLVMFKIHVLNIIIHSLISNSKALNPYNYMYW